MTFEIVNDVIAKLYIDDQNIIYPWGIETSDSSAFFSLEKGVGYRYSELFNEEKVSHQSYSYSKIIQMHEGKWKIDGNESLIGNKVLRHVELTCLEDSFFLDFVMRFRFNKDFFNTAYISGNTIQHANSNVYYQYPTSYCKLDGSLHAEIKVLNSECPNTMMKLMYVRDHEDEWVIHARMLPVADENIVIKLCNRWYKTKPLPRLCTKILCSIPEVYPRIKYGNERIPYTNWLMKKICPNAFPMIIAPKGSRFVWDIEVVINE